MPHARRTQVLAPLSNADRGGADAAGAEFALVCSLAALEGGSLRRPDVEVAAVELARCLGHLRAMLTRYVRARRAAAVPVARVLAEVGELVRLGAAQEAWSDPDGALTHQALRCALEVYQDYGRPIPPGARYVS